MENSKIEWCDHTFNPWIGCTRVSPGCDNCYAADLARRYGWHDWGAKTERKITSDANWRKPHQWNKNAAFYERRPRVFCASLADVFDNKAPANARPDLFRMIADTQNLDWLLLTKRPENVRRFLPSDWGNGYRNVWLGITAESQAEFDRRWPKLARIPAAVRFVSYEPAVDSLRLRADSHRQPDWLIIGGESGPKARTMRAQWARDIRNDCRRFGVAVFMKQWGTYKSNPFVTEYGCRQFEARKMDPPSNGKGGALLDNEILREFPPSALVIAQPRLV